MLFIMEAQFLYIHTEDTSIILSLQDIIEFNPDSPVIVSKTDCFVHEEGGRLDTRLIFTNNTAGHVLYGGLVALGYDELLQRRGNECDSKQL